MSKKESNPNKPSHHEKRAAKKAAVLGSQKKSRMRLFAVSFCALALIVVAIFVFNIKAKGPSSTASSAEVTYPAKLFQDGEARHFQYKAGNGITVKYFVLKSSDGVIRAAFDACDVCWPSGKGYYQEGDFMVCRNCGKRFASIRVNEVRGGCNPAPLSRAVLDGKLVIEVEDILEGTKYFDFSRTG